MSHPSDIFEVKGYFVEYIGADTHKCYGYELIAEQGDWELGFKGRKVVTLTSNVELHKGVKTVTLKASSNKPITVTKMCHAVCGRSKLDIVYKY